MNSFLTSKEKIIEKTSEITNNLMEKALNTSIQDIKLSDQTDVNKFP